MERKFKEALSHRRSYYALSNKSLVSDEEIENIVKFAVKNIPSAFNSQSTRIVLLLGEQHVKLWNIVKDTLRKIVPAEAFKTTENKIDKSFASGYGTGYVDCGADVAEQPVYGWSFTVLYYGESGWQDRKSTRLNSSHT